MNLSFLLRSSFFLAIGITCAMKQGFCESDIDTRVSRLEADMKKVRGQTAFGNYGAKTPSAAPQTNGFGYFITADFLWWKLYEFQDDFVYKDKKTTGVPPFKGKVENVDFNWEPGFRVGAGYVFDYDGWDVSFHFTDYETHASNSKHSSSKGFLLPIWDFDILPLSKIHTHWEVHYFDLDLVLGRNYFVSKYLSLRPFIGLASTWINQHKRAKEVVFAFPNVVAKVKGKNNFWGIGPRLGLDSQFFLGRHFSLYGNVEGSLLWGRFDVHEKESIKALDAVIYDENLNTHRMAPMVACGLGVAFETNFNKNENHFLVKLGYESQYWWQQNQFPVLYLPSFSQKRESGDLSIAGLTLDFRLDF